MRTDKLVWLLGLFKTNQNRRAASFQKKASCCAQYFGFGMKARAFALQRYMARLAATQRQQTEEIN